jgi:hypothetical protein
MNQKIGILISNDSILEQLIKNMNESIINNESTVAISLLEFIINAKEKDKIVYYYYNYMIQRIMFLYPKVNVELESNLNKLLNQNLGQKLCFKINKVVTDVQNSLIHHNNYIELCKSDIFKTITTSFNNWSINQQEGVINTKMIDVLPNNSLVKGYLDNFNKFYNATWQEKRIINWFPHFGSVTINYLGQDVIMLPVQFMVLELFNDIDKMNINDVLNYKLLDNYTTEFKENIIKSLIISGIIKKDDSELIITSTINKTNLIEILFNETDIIELWTARQKEEFVLSRIEIVCSNINHIIKKNPMTPTDLLAYLDSTIELFETSKEKDLFEKSIDYLIINELIEFKEGTYNKIYY